ncbi:MAG: hypothetical protein Q6K80_09920 [Thermostichus sp. DG_1_6_bins_120]
MNWDKRVKKWQLPLLGITLGILWVWGVRPVQAQLRLIPEAARQVYSMLPDFPLESTYVSPDGSGPSPEEDTLVRRMMVYHLQVAGRSLTDRFDWQLTLADYFDANEPMIAQRYPGADRLTVNPYAQDKAVIQSLNRQQRQALLKAILLALGGDPNPTPLYIPEDVEPVAPRPTSTPVQRLLIPGTGAADLLRP